MPNIPPTSLALCSAATSASWHPKHISDAVRAAPGQATHAFGGGNGSGGWHDRVVGGGDAGRGGGDRWWWVTVS